MTHTREESPGTRLRQPYPTGGLDKQADHFGPGDRIAGTMLVREVLEGGMGRVYVAHHEGWDLDVVVKMPKPEVLGDAEGLARMTREAEAWTDLGLHPHIAYCYYVLPVGEVPALVVEYLDGGNLLAWIEAGGGRDVRAALDLGIQACHGLEHAHGRGMVHRDVKPENLLLSRDGTLKVTDFGIVRLGAADAGSWSLAGLDARSLGGRLTLGGGTGTPAYMAPEQWEDAHGVDARTDVFALGVVLYEMLCGRRPYDLTTGPAQAAPDPGRLRGDGALPPALGSLLRRMAAWTRDDRPGSAAEVRRELCAVYASLAGTPSAWAELPEVSLEADGWNNRGVSYVELRRVDEARACFQRARTRNPQHVESVCNAALLDWREARADDLEVLRRLDRLSESVSVSRRDLALAVADVHQERFAPDASRAWLDETPGLYERRYAGTEASLVSAAEPLPDTELHCRVACVEGRWLGLTGYRLIGDCVLLGDTLVLWDFERSAPWRVFDAHPRVLTAWALGPLGGRAVSADEGGGIRVWDVATARCLTELRGGESPIRNVALGPGGRTVVSVDQTGLAALWDVTSGALVSETRLVRPGDADPAPWYGLEAVLEEERAVFAFMGPESVWTWSFGASPERRLPQVRFLRCLALAPDGRRAAAAGPDGAARLWEIESGRCRLQLLGHSADVQALAMTPDGRCVLTASKDRTIKVWDAESGRCLRTLEGHPAGVSDVAVDPAGREVLSRDDHHNLARRWILDRSRPRPASWRVSCPRSVGALLARQAELREQRRLSRRLSEQGRPREALQALLEAWREVGFAGDGAWRDAYRQLRARGAIRTLVDIGIDRLAGPGGGSRWVAVSPDGRTAVSVHSAVPSMGPGEEHVNCLEVWNLDRRAAERAIEWRSAQPSDGVVVSRDGRVAVSAEGVNRRYPYAEGHSALRSWNLDTGERLASAETSRVRSLQVRPDGEVAIVALARAQRAAGSSLRFWQTRSGAWLSSGQPVSDDVRAIALAPGGRTALSAGREVMVWDLDELRLVGETSVLSVSGFFPASALAVAGGPEGLGVLMAFQGESSLHLVDLGSRRRLGPMHGHSAAITAVTMSAEGKWALSGAEDDTVRLWSLAENRCEKEISIGSPPTSLAFSDDATRAVSGHEDGSLVCWNLVWDLEFRE